MPDVIASSTPFLYLLLSADLATFAASIVIPAVLAYYLLRRRDAPFPRTLLLAGTFIFACGVAKLIDAVAVYYPVYPLAGVIKVLTAGLSWGSVLTLLVAVPRMLASKSIVQLEEEVARRTRELEEREARYRAIVDTAEFAILTLDDEWNIESANPVCERMFGTARPDLIGRRFTNWLAAGDSDMSLLGTGEGKLFGPSGEIVARRQDGTTFPASLAMSKISLGDRRLYTVMMHDLTAVKRAEEAHRQSETRLRTMLAQVPAVLCTTNRKLRIDLFACSASTGLSGAGLGSNRLTGVSLAEPPADDLARVLPVPAFQKALRGEAVSASVRWNNRVFQFHVQPLRDGRQAVYGTIGVGIDITRLTRTQQALRNSEAKIRAIVQAAAEGVILINEQGVIKSVNRACNELFGYGPRELVGQNVRLLMPEPHRGQHDGYLENYLRTGERRMLGAGREVEGRRKDGSTFPMYLAVSEIPFGSRRRVYVGLVHDMTEQKRVKQELEFYARQLRERNQELTRSNSELDDFAHIVSHDLKEPLRGIRNYCGFIAEDYGERLDDEGRERLRRMQHLTRQMERMIDSLHQYSRVGRVELAVQETDLGELVAEVRDSLQIGLQQAGVELLVRGPLPTVRCDRIRIAEVLRNLIANAMKYNDKPHKWIEVGAADPDGEEFRAAGGAAARPSWVFYVKDNGIGIPEKHLAAVFKMFRRLHARDQYGGGTGVGLSIVKRILERHGGGIFVASTPGTGTTFFFTIPKEMPEARGQRPEARGQKPEDRGQRAEV